MQQAKTFQIPGMTDEDADMIENTLQQIAGVIRVDLHKPTQTVTIQWNEPPAQWGDFELHLREIGFTPDLP